MWWSDSEKIPTLLPSAAWQDVVDAFKTPREKQQRPLIYSKTTIDLVVDRINVLRSSSIKESFDERRDVHPTLTAFRAKTFGAKLKKYRR
jgi:hypothetical protein